ncbi:MAG: glycerol-3-phosphate 1-O-acyltransferase PlsY, partial [candidate division Zixibacteria bacterium]|nr:glycerol-3-phosphate 1-O-acyltransferase PlsY [candidate division Zixibacteria bacterium]
MIEIVSVVIAYLLGSLPTGLWVSRIYGVKDIRTEGSGNIGATNVARVLGHRVAVWVYIGDIGKGILAILLTRYIAGRFGTEFFGFDLLLVIVAAAAVLGHVFPIYLRFKGGKGVNTGLGVMVSLLPYETVLAVGLFLLMVLLTRYISVGSMTAGAGLFIMVLIERYMLAQSVAQVYVYL